MFMCIFLNLVNLLYIFIYSNKLLTRTNLLNINLILDIFYKVSELLCH